MQHQPQADNRVRVHNLPVRDHAGPSREDAEEHAPQREIARDRACELTSLGLATHFAPGDAQPAHFA
eukprot:6207014-Pleurochrysis_carterae.AAC.1